MNKIIMFLILLFSNYCFSQNKNMPKNLEPGKCYIKYNVGNDNNEWRDIDCDLLTRNSELRVKINTEAKVLSKKNKKTIDRKIVKLIKKEFVILIEVHHDSEANDSINTELSNKKTQILADYFDSIEIPTNMVWITSFGNTKVKNKCKDNTKDCEKLYHTNSKITYKVVLGGKPSQGDEYRYDEKLGEYYWCKTNE